MEATPAPTRSFTPAPAKGKGEAILLIDDEPMVRDTLQLLLQRGGYRVIPAGDATSGLTAFSRHESEITLVITDMMLPDKPGTEVVRALRTKSPNLPVIAMSGMMGSGNFDELRTLQPRVECLSKPLSPSTLLAAVRRGVPAEAAAFV